MGALEILIIIMIISDFAHYLGLSTGLDQIDDISA